MRPKETPEYKFVGALLWGNFEIQTLYFDISHVGQYFSRSPRGLSSFRSDYLAFVIHAYLNQLYIAQQRMSTYPTALSRAAAKGSEVRDRIEKIKPDLLRLVADAFKSVRTIRGSHVHKERFADEGVGRLQTFELMIRFKGHFPPVEGLYRSELHRVRKIWSRTFGVNETAIKVLIEHYYEVLLNALFKPDGTLRSFL